MYARLEREAWAAARVANRNVVTVYDVATEQGRPWIVMELVRGISLAELLEADGPITPRRAARIGAEVLAALRAAHAAGVLHRDRSRRTCCCRTTAGWCSPTSGSPWSRAAPR
ncbi:hypothetical protein SGLAM104S_05685 [Streptomyces glaucescens]